MTGSATVPVGSRAVASWTTLRGNGRSAGTATGRVRHRGPEVPLGINTAIGAVCVVLASVAAHLVAGTAARLTLLSFVLAAFGYFCADAAAAVVTAVVAFTLLDGFGENGSAVLSWHNGDLWRAAVLLAAGSAGVGLGLLRHALRDRRAHRDRGARRDRRVHRDPRAHRSGRGAR